jgi:hypothetical protein
MAREQSVSRDDFARQHGFASYLEMFESSTPVATADSRKWCITPVAGGKWLAWNDGDRAAASFDSKDAAVAHIERTAGVQSANV